MIRSPNGMNVPVRKAEVVNCRGAKFLPDSGWDGGLLRVSSAIADNNEKLWQFKFLQSNSEPKKEMRDPCIRDMKTKLVLKRSRFFSHFLAHEN
jgi:hypothetical protein